MPLVLASSSPRRLDLLARIGLVPDRIFSPDIAEVPRKGELPRDYVQRMALEKAQGAPRAADEIVLAGDTIVAAGRRILGKAHDEADQRRFLTLLSGRRHDVLSAVCVIDTSGTARVRLSASVVRFKPLHACEIDAYVACGEGLGKAGGYAIQGRAEALVKWVQGSHSGIIGLPLYETRLLLLAAGVALG